MISLAFSTVSMRIKRISSESAKSWIFYYSLASSSFLSTSCSLLVFIMSKYRLTSYLSVWLVSWICLPLSSSVLSWMVYLFSSKLAVSSTLRFFLKALRARSVFAPLSCWSSIVYLINGSNLSTSSIVDRSYGLLSINFLYSVIIVVRQSIKLAWFFISYVTLPCYILDMIRIRSLAGISC